MEDLNRVAIVGRLTRDPDVRGNNNVMAMRLAVNTRDRDPDTGEWGDRGNFFDAVLFGENRVSALSKMVGKGSRVGIDGKLSWREWQDKEGNNRQSVEIRADNLFLLDSRGERSEPQQDEDDFGF